MPGLGPIAATLTVPDAAPFSLFVGPYDVIDAVPLENIRFEDNGAAEVGQMEFDVIDMALGLSLGDAAPIRFEDNAAGLTRWAGEIMNRDPTIIATGRAIHITCRHIGYILDESLVPSDWRWQDSTGFSDPGVTGETDRGRILYFLAVYLSRLPSPDGSQIIQLASGPGVLTPQRYNGLTTRQAIEAVAAQASINGTYRIHGAGRLHYFNGTTGDAGAAPYAIRIGTPGGGEMAPENLLIKFDSSGLLNAYYVKGATAAGSGWVTDVPSILAYGRHEAYIDAPDADTAAKRDAVGNAALADTKNPVGRGSFEATSPFDGWVSGQTLTINSAPQFNISAPTTYRVTSVTTTFLSGKGDRHYDISFGAAPASYIRNA